MDYRYLKAFYEVGRHENFTKAGDELNIAQSAISRQVKLLEDSIGHQLIIRSPKKVFLTKKGRDLFNQLDHMESWVKHDFNKEKQTINIGTLPGILESWLTDKLCSIPNLPNLNIVIGTVDDLAIQINKGELDFLITTQAIENESVSSIKIFQESYCLISKKEIDIKNTHKYTWIFANHGSYLKRFSKKVSPNFIRVNSMRSMISFVKNKHGIAIIPKQIAVKEKSLTIYPIPKYKKETIYLCSPNYKIIPSIHKFMIKALQE